MATRLAPDRAARALRPDAAPAPAPAERRHLRVIPPDYISARARQKRARRLALLGGVAVAAMLFGVVAFHVVLTQNQLNIQHLRSEADAASVKQQQLRLQVAELESPERVVDAAQKLGMVPPATVHYLSPNATGTAPATPTPTTAPPHPATPKAYAPAAKTTATTAPAKAAVPKPATAKTSKPSAAPTTTTPARRTR